MVHAEDDKKQRELSEARNELDTLVYSSEKALKEYGSNISDADRKKVETELESAKKIKDDDKATVDQLKSVTEKLNEATHKLAEVMYQEAAKKQQAAGGDAGAAGAGPGPEASQQTDGDKKDGGNKEKFEDADFEVVDDK